MTENKKKLYFYIIMMVLAIPQFDYRIKHPKMTETELFLNFFTAYKDFFNERV